MTTEFAASNGHKIVRQHDDRLAIFDPRGTIDRGVRASLTAALREYFTAERDTELGRLRDPENTNMVVYRVPENDDKDGRAVRVVDEATGVYASLWERDVKRFERGSMHATAARWFAAHPEPRPWYDAQDGELWVLTINDEQAGALAWRTSAGPQFETATGTLHHYDPGITAGRRLYPEESDDE